MIAGQCRDVPQRVAIRRKGGATKTLPTQFDAHKPMFQRVISTRSVQSIMGATEIFLLIIKSLNLFFKSPFSTFRGHSWEFIR